MTSEQEGGNRRGDNFDFEELCLDPYQSQLDDGRNEGEIAGMQAGFDEGRSLGQRKALELGLELGYIYGVTDNIMKEVLPEMESRVDDAESQRRVERIKKGVTELIAAIDSFPTPDEMFRHTRGDLALDDNDDGGHSYRDSHENDTEEYSAHSRSYGVDVANKMQRIRAKFKLISVQLKMPQLSLSRVMDEAAKAPDAYARAANSPIEGVGVSGGEKKNREDSEGHDW